MMIIMIESAMLTVIVIIKIWWWSGSNDWGDDENGHDDEVGDVRSNRGGQVLSQVLDVGDCGDHDGHSDAVYIVKNKIIYGWM